MNQTGSEIATPQALSEALADDPTINALRRLIAGASCAVLVADRVGRYVAANDRACDLTGYTIGDLLRKTLSDLTGAADDRVAEVLWRAFLDRGQQTGKFSIRRHDGSSVLVRYDALANILPGFHVTFLTPA